MTKDVASSWLAALALWVGCTTDVSAPTGPDLDSDGSAAPPSGSEAEPGPTPAGPLPQGSGQCQQQAAGVFAFRALTDVWWGREGSVTNPGRGILQQFFIARFDPPDASLGYTGTIQPCGTHIPAFEAGPVCEAYQTRFEPWETVPRIAVAGSWSCLDPGCSGSLSGVTSLIGISLDEEDGDWPTAAQTTSVTCPEGSAADCFPDSDGDGQPGVTASMVLNGVYKPSDCLLGLDRRFAGAPPGPIEALLPTQPRVATIFVGIRTAMEGSLTVNDDCNGGEGSGTVRFIDSRALDCVLDNGEACSAADASYVDENLPVHRALAAGETPPPAVGDVAIEDQSPSEGLRFEALRLGDLEQDVSCAQAMAMFDDP